MPLGKPFPRTWRPFLTDHVDGYMKDSRFAEHPEHYMRAFRLISTDISELFYYIEPGATNINTFSHRIHEILMRTCIEVEANCKAILSANKYNKNTSDMNMSDYKKLELTHRLSEYEVMISEWADDQYKIRKPFANWSSGSALPWYVAYNTVKHNRQEHFAEANFLHLTDAVSALSALIGAQFRDYPYQGFPFSGGMSAVDIFKGGFEDNPSSSFPVKYPSSWGANESYNFVWTMLRTASEPFDFLSF